MLNARAGPTSRLESLRYDDSLRNDDSRGYTLARPLFPWEDPMRSRTYCAALVACAVSIAATARAQIAPDATGLGPYATTSAEYKLPAAIDPDVSAELATALWARVYRPSNLANA